MLENDPMKQQNEVELGMEYRREPSITETIAP